MQQRVHARAGVQGTLAGGRPRITARRGALLCQPGPSGDVHAGVVAGKLGQSWGSDLRQPGEPGGGHWDGALPAAEHRRCGRARAVMDIDWLEMDRLECLFAVLEAPTFALTQELGSPQRQRQRSVTER